MLNFRDFKAFVELAHRLHFQEAADQLNISAATLSRVISRVEEKVGTRLFDRTTRSVVLTVAGQAFLREVEILLRQQKNAMRIAHDIGLGLSGNLKLGYGGVAVETFLPDMIAGFRADFPGVFIDLNLLPIQEQENGLLRKDLDIGFFCGTTRNSELRYKSCYRQPLFLIMSSAHPLNSLNSIRLADLESYGFVLGKREKWVSVYDTFLDSCNQNGVDIRVELEADDVASVMGLVATSELLSLFPASLECMRRAGVCWREIQDFSDQTVVNAVWRRDNQNPALHKWLQHIF